MAHDFLFLSDDGDREPTTFSAAVGQAKLQIKGDEPDQGDPWPDWVTDTAVAAVILRATEVNRQDAACDQCGAAQGEAHEPDCSDGDDDGSPFRTEFDYTCGYELRPVPEVIAQVLELATDEQLQVELARRRAAT